MSQGSTSSSSTAWPLSSKTKSSNTAAAGSASPTSSSGSVSPLTGLKTGGDNANMLVSYEEKLAEEKWKPMKKRKHNVQEEKM